MSSGEWVCDAYAAEAHQLGAVCFFAPNMNERTCETQAVCRDRLDPVWAELIKQIPGGPEPIR